MLEVFVRHVLQKLGGGKNAIRIQGVGKLLRVQWSGVFCNSPQSKG